MKCIICDGEDFKLKFSGRDLLHDLDGNFQLFECKNCKLVTLDPKLTDDEFEKYYPNDYLSFPLSIETEKNLFKKIDRQFGVNKRVNRILKKEKKSGKILDIGCATGIFLNEMKNKGWDCYGVEPNNFAANYGKEYFDLNIINKPFEQTNFLNSFFDVVTMWDVLEHVENPDLVAKELYRILKPDGLLVVSMPNSDSIECKIFGKYWAGWDIPRHNNIFDSKNINNYFSKYNLYSEGISSFTGRHGVIVLSINFYLNQKKYPKKIKKIINLVIKSTIARVITYPYYMIIDRLNKSSIMTLFIRKRKFDL
ncbi:MAG: class I SAM-dependent methyltransferase [Anaerolineaceae bacterium]|nr:class I SAM-dependent methyltransferase [Anaerolineaceae bacterium]